MVALRRFAALAEGMGVSPLLTVATAAVRDAEDGPEFREEVLARNRAGDPDHRRRRGGAAVGAGRAAGLARVRRGWSATSAARPWNWPSFWAGARWGSAHLDLGPLEADGAEGRQEGDARPYQGPRGGVGRGFPASEPPVPRRRVVARHRADRHGAARLPAEGAARIPDDAQGDPRHDRDDRRRDIDALRAKTGTSAERMRLVPLAAEVLKAAVRELKPKEIAVSSYGIREGLLYEQMSDALRHRDPLIEAARHAEASSARMPGFGRALYHFVEPLFPRAKHSGSCLVRAACLLHDVSWRAHPDYRAEVCFDNATRANLGGLTHGERVYLGLALLHRYKSNRDNTNFNAELLTLLPEAQVMEAEILGRAMRFGCDVHRGAAHRSRGADLAAEAQGADPDAEDRRGPRAVRRGDARRASRRWLARWAQRRRWRAAAKAASGRRWRKCGASRAGPVFRSVSRQSRPDPYRRPRIPR
jgi:exopolyphosphatase/guanosine-5'-triphosphate,3'-diphosphate pyrophosphatase